MRLTDKQITAGLIITYALAIVATVYYNNFAFIGFTVIGSLITTMTLLDERE